MIGKTFAHYEITYELAAGRRLFDGDTVSDTIASILKMEWYIDDRGVYSVMSRSPAATTRPDAAGTNLGEDEGRSVRATWCADGRASWSGDSSRRSRRDFEQEWTCQ